MNIAEDVIDLHGNKVIDRGCVKKEEKIAFLHMFRGIGALLVVWSHWGDVFFGRNSAAAQLCFFREIHFEKLPGLLCITQDLHLIGIDLGMIGVAFFFLISGFLISKSLKKYKGWRFLTQRMWRLYPTYAVGLLFSCATLYICAKYNGIDSSSSLNFKNYVLNLSLFRDWFGTPTIDGINWTMECDVKFYLLCVFIVWISNLYNEKLIFSLLGIGTLVNYLTTGIYGIMLTKAVYLYRFFLIINGAMPFICIMFIGVSIYNHYCNKWTSKKLGASIFVLGIMFGINCWLSYRGLFGSFLISYGISLSVFVLSYYNRQKFREIRFIKHCGDISFSLYLVHGVAGYVIMSFLFSYQNNIYLVLFETMVIITIVAESLHFGVEKPILNLSRKNG